MCAATLAATAQQDAETVMQQAQPGPAHEILKMMEGTWKQKVTSTMEPGKPTTGAGKATHTMILGGRFLEMKGSAELFGMKVASQTILGHDNRKGKYFAYSIDELGTYAVSATGDYDAATKTLTLHGEEREGEMVMRFKFVFRIIDKNHMHFSVIFAMPEGEQSMIEIEWTRV